MIKLRHLLFTYFRLGSLIASFFLVLGSNFAQGQWQDTMLAAITQLEEENPALALKLLNELASQGDSKFQLQQALLSKKLAHYEKSLYIFDQILSKDPQHQLALLETADLLERMNLLKESLIIYNRFLEKNPNHKIARRNRGSVYFKLADCKNATLDLEESGWSHLNWVQKMLDQCKSQTQLHSAGIGIDQSENSQALEKTQIAKSSNHSITTQEEPIAPTSPSKNKPAARPINESSQRKIDQLSWWPSIEYVNATSNFDYAVELIEKQNFEGARRVLEGESHNPWSLALLDFLTARISKSKMNDISASMIVDSPNQLLQILKMKHSGYKQASQFDAEGPEWRYHVARQALVESNSIEALKQLSLGMKSWPDRSEFYYLSAQIMHEMGRLEDRDEFYLKAQSLKANHPMFPSYQ